MPEPTPDPTASTVLTGLFGLVGGVLSLLFGGHNLNPWQRIGCLISGVACSIVFGPVVLLIWPSCPSAMLSAAGLVIGLGGLFIVRALLVWWRLAERGLPGAISKAVKDKTGLDLHSPDDKDGPGTPEPPAKPTGGP